MTQGPHPIEIEFTRPMTLAQIELFCEAARHRGASDDDRVTTLPFRRSVRGLRVVPSLAHNREQAHRKDAQA